ncbi:MAG: hypothetical protein LBQ90_02595 [Synergistaceae bacterium]|jgi:hypothetical protein|nr:hypothetical protein [Synergistaceae bacterium]
MSKLKCAHCRKKAAQRKCPVVGGYICSFCCGSNRSSEFGCPSDCDYLENEAFFKEAQQSKELRRLLATVPSGQFDDIFQDAHYAEIAYPIEKNVAAAYVSGIYILNDQKVKEAYYATYRMLKGDEPAGKGLPGDLLTLGKKLKCPRDDLALVLLRLIISVNKMTGGTLGPYSYLDYIKYNILPK